MKSILAIGVRLLVLAGVGWLAGCRTAPPAKPPGPGAVRVAPATGVTEQRLTDEQAEARAEAFARFATGISHELNDRSDEALDQFYKAVEADPSNEVLAVELARRLIQKDQGEKALTLLTKVEARPGSSATVSAWISRAYLQTGRTNQAIQASRVAIRKAPESIVGYQILLEIYVARKQLPEAEKVLAQAAGQPSTSLAFLLGVSELHAMYFRLQPARAEALKPQALGTLRRVTERKPVGPNLLVKLADLYDLFGDPKTAAETYLKLIEQNPEEPLMRDLLRERLTNVYLRDRDTDKAAAQLEAIIRDNPTMYPQAYNYLGMLADEKKDYPKAIEYLKRALILRPDFEPTYHDLARIQLNLEQPDDSLATLDRARARFPRNFGVEFLAGLAWSAKKDFPAAIKAYTTAEVIGKTEPQRLTAGFYFYFGAAAERQKDFVLAEKLFLKSIELDRDFAESLNYLGYMWADRNEKLPQARDYIEHAVKLEPKNAAFLDSLGWVYFRLKQPKKALDYILRSIELSKEPDATLYDHLGEIYQVLGQGRDAVMAWEKSIKIEANDEVKSKLEKASSDSK